MSTEKVVRYTAEDMESRAQTMAVKGYTGTAAMLRQAARTESDVAGLVECLEWMTALLNDPGADDLEGWKLQCKHWTKRSREELARVQQ